MHGRFGTLKKYLLVRLMYAMFVKNTYLLNSIAPSISLSAGIDLQNTYFLGGTP